MKIKALSLWQPWASLVALGAKKFETRSWATAHRGPLLICASKKFSAECEKLLLQEPFKSALRDLIQTDGIVTGAAVCVVDVVECWEIMDLMHSTSKPPQGPAYIPRGDEREFGDYSQGRFAWQLANVRTFKPFAVTGRQGLFEVEVPDAFVQGGA